MDKNLIFVVLILLFFSCTEEVKKETTAPVNAVLPLLEVPTRTIDKSTLHFDKKTSLWTVDGELFSGHAVSYFPDSTMKQKLSFLEGKKQNQTIDWYPDGQMKHLATYYNGKLQGEKKSWSPDPKHVLVSHLNYNLGKLHGTQKKWYSTGELYKVLSLNMGKEEGIQRAYRMNGDLYANYEARNGRIFGLKRAALCFGLEDEKIQYGK